MQATLCDNCKKPAATPAEQVGWLRMGRLRWEKHEEQGPGGPPGLPPGLAQMMGMGGGHPGGCEGHLTLEKEVDLCSELCLLSFIQNDWQPMLVDNLPETTGD